MAARQILDLQVVVQIRLGQHDRELWQTWCMRKTENLENVVQLHEAPQ